MPDRRRHAALPLALPTETPGGGAMRIARMSHDRPTPPSSDEQRDNPFAPPPEGQPDRPWQPRQRPQGAQGPRDQGDEGSQDDGGSGDGQQPPAWGSQWSSRQPGRHDGGFGGGTGGPGGPAGGPGGNGGGLRWDPTDPAQRRARYALLAGMWGFFFALFSIPYVALLLGALSLYWGVSALRAKARPQRQDPDTPAGPAPAPGAFRPQTTAAVSGLVTGGLALAIVAATFVFQIVYSDYYTCVDDALTQSSQQACEKHLPKQLRPLLGNRD
ncbi:hypothetical protein [Streptomyces sp. URMC 124]|uniref:hypothetical protein n=1 Tax=Streptomyces sp. URMC 124 TaxID=3423405 RepID=UPI003F1D2B5C